MRPKIVLLILFMGAAGVALIFFLKSKATPSQEVPPVAQIQPPSTLETAPVAQNVSPLPTNPAISVPTHLEPSRPFTTGRVVGDGAEDVQEQINHLDELEANDDDASLQAILKELTNTNPIIRHAAIEATIQFGGHKAVPVLQGLAAQTWNPGEKKELLDAAEFLALPSLSEVRAQEGQTPLAPPQDSPQDSPPQ